MQAGVEGCQAAGAESETAPDAKPPYDARFEFDAPRFYDFGAGSPEGSGRADAWFETSATKGLASPDSAGTTRREEQQGTHAKPEALEHRKGASTAAGKGVSKCGKAPAAQPSNRPALAAITNTATIQVVAAVHPAGKAAQPRVHKATASKRQERDANSQPVSAAPKEQHDVDPSRKEGSSGNALQPRHRSTVRFSPRLRTRLRSGNQEAKSSEELELEQLAAEKEEEAQLRKRNAEALKAVLQPPPQAAHSSKPLTEPVEVQLHTAKRQRQHTMETRSIASFSAGDAADGSTTAAQPKLTTAADVGQGALTVPQSPAFATKARARPPRFKPREVVEEEEMAAMPKFKARPFNKEALLAHGQAGVPWVGARPPTAPEPFHFVTTERAVLHGDSSTGAGANVVVGAAAGSAAETFVFEAQTAASEGGRVTRSRAKKQKAWNGELTIPQPFQLATDARAKRTAGTAAIEVQDAPPAKRAKRGSMPAAGAFKLQTEARGVLAQERLEQQRAVEQEQRRREAEFRARPLNKAALERPFIVAPSGAELTVPLEVHFETEKRAAQREVFDVQLAAQQAALAARAAEEEEERQQEEEQQIRELRRAMVPKARPMADGRQVASRVFLPQQPS